MSIFQVVKGWGEKALRDDINTAVQKVEKVEFRNRVWSRQIVKSTSWRRLRGIGWTAAWLLGSWKSAMAWVDDTNLSVLITSTLATSSPCFLRYYHRGDDFFFSLLLSVTMASPSKALATSSSCQGVDATGCAPLREGTRWEFLLESVYTGYPKEALNEVPYAELRMACRQWKHILRIQIPKAHDDQSTSTFIEKTMPEERKTDKSFKLEDLSPRAQPRRIPILTCLHMLRRRHRNGQKTRREVSLCNRDLGFLFRTKGVAHPPRLSKNSERMKQRRPE